MFTRKFVMLSAAVVALLFCCAAADAGPFGIFGRNRATKAVRYTPNGSACVSGPDGNCLTHPIGQSAIAAADVATGPAQLAMAAVAEAEVALEAANAQAARVRDEQRRAVARKRLELQNQIDDLLAQKQALGPLATE